MYKYNPPTKEVIPQVFAYHHMQVVGYPLQVK